MKIDDHFDEHPKIAAAGPLATALFIAGICYSNRNLTDGFIPTAAARNLGGTKKAIATLLREKLWETCEGGFIVHDYLLYQRSKAEVLADRENTRLRVARYRSGNVAVTPLHSKSNAVSNAAQKQKEKQKEKEPLPSPVPQEDLERERESALARASPKRNSQLTPDEREKLLSRFAAALGGRRAVAEEIDVARAHKSATKWKHEYPGLLNWLKGTCERRRIPIPDLTVDHGDDPLPDEHDYDDPNEWERVKARWLERHPEEVGYVP